METLQSRFAVQVSKPERRCRRRRHHPHRYKQFLRAFEAGEVGRWRTTTEGTGPGRDWNWRWNSTTRGATRRNSPVLHHQSEPASYDRNRGFQRDFQEPARELAEAIMAVDDLIKLFGMQNLLLESELKKLEDSGIQIGHAQTIQKA